MADIPTWLKGFQRARSPNAHIVTNRFDRLDEAKNIEDVQSPLTAAKVSPKMSFSLPGVVPESTSAVSHTNRVETTWHNPDPNQMAETLRVAMMTQSSFDPLDIRFNSCILHVLEAYQHMSQVLKDKDQEIERLRRFYEESRRHIGQQALKWREKEDGYRTDINALEIILATEARGLELVTMARSRSIMNQISPTGDDCYYSAEELEALTLAPPEGGSSNSDFAEAGRSFNAESYYSNKRGKDVNTRLTVCTEQLSQVGQGTELLKQPRRSRGAIGAGRNEKPAIFEQLRPSAYDEKLSDSAEDLSPAARYRSSYYCRHCKSNVKKPVGIGQCLDNMGNSKLVPRKACKENLATPRVPLGKECGCDKGEFIASRVATHQRVFSFDTGDDYESLPVREHKSQAKAFVSDNCRYKQEESNCNLSSIGDDVYNPLGEADHLSRPKPVTSGHVHILDTRESRPKNGDSQHSILQSMQDQGWSCKALGIRDAPEDVGMGRQNSSNEAKIAAIRAIADSAKSSSSRNARG